MGSITVHEFTTLDGVVDAPVWTVDFGFPDDLAVAVGGLTAGADGILLGRRTYEMFGPAWSTRSAEDDPGAPFFNDTTKYVVSGSLTDPGWGPAEVLPYDVDRLRALKAEHDLYVSGSATLVRALLADGLVDQLHQFVYPVTVGAGTRLFPEGGTPARLALHGATGLSNGVAHLVHGPA